jgi:hypothetical protein
MAYTESEYGYIPVGAFNFITDPTKVPNGTRVTTLGDNGYTHTTGTIINGQYVEDML